MQHHKIDYAEYPCRDLAQTKTFFERAFQWSFTDYGPEYSSFSDQGINGGFYQADNVATVATGSALLVFFSEDLEQSRQQIEQAGGKIVVEPFDFPGGRRFHFTEPSGNEFAVWALN